MSPRNEDAVSEQAVDARASEGTASQVARELDSEDRELLAALVGAPADVAALALQAQPFGTRSVLEAYEVIDVVGPPRARTVDITTFGWQVMAAAADLVESGDGESYESLRRVALARARELAAVQHD